MTVVHCKRESYDVYIGRGRCPVSGEPGRWGNPFKLSPSESRGATLAKYRAWLWAEITTGRIELHHLAALDGKVLGCWCAPQPCHGNVLASAASWAVGELGLASRVMAEKPLTRFDIEKLAPRDDSIMLGASAPYVAFQYALQQGWINQADYDAAQKASGRMWNYCGD